MKKYDRIVLCVLLILSLSTQLTSAYAKTNRTVVVATQKQLESAIRNEKCEIIHVATKKKVTLQIPKDRRTKSKTLVVNAPNATIVNEATFQKVQLLGEKITKFTERGKNNSILCSVKNLNLAVNSKSNVKKLNVKSAKGKIVLTNTSKIDLLTFEKESKLEAVLHGVVKAVEVNKAASIQFSGKVSNTVPITVNAKGTVIKTSQSLKLKTLSNSILVIENHKALLDIIVTKQSTKTEIQNHTNKKVKYQLNGKSYSLKQNAQVNFIYDQLITDAPEVAPKPEDSIDLLKKALAAVPVHMNYYTVASSEKVEQIKKEIPENLEELSEEEMTEYAKKLNEAIEQLEYKKMDVGQVYITTSTSPHIKIGEYVSAQIAVVDKIGGSHKTVEFNDTKIKVRGNTTAYAAKKPYTLKLKTEQDLFGLGTSKKWVLLANALDPTLLRNELVFQFAKSIGLQYTSNSCYVEVWLDGVYMGNYQLVEPVEVGETKVDIDVNNGDYLLEVETYREEEDVEYITTPIYGYRFAINDPKVLTAEDRQKLEQYLQQIEQAIEHQSYQEINARIDLNSFIDAYLLYELFKNLDVNESSTRFYIKDGIIYAGPVWDFDLSSGNCGYIFAEYNNIHGTGTGTGNSYEGLRAWKNNWFASLLEVPEIYEMLVQRYQQLQPVITNLYEDSESSLSLINQYTQKYEATFNRNFTWTEWSFGHHMHDYMRVPEDTYEKNVNYLKEWLKHRNEWLLKHLEIKE